MSHHKPYSAEWFQEKNADGWRATCVVLKWGCSCTGGQFGLQGILGHLIDGGVVERVRFENMDTGDEVWVRPVVGEQPVLDSAESCSTSHKGCAPATEGLG